MEEEVKLKKCARCHEEKELDQFHLDSSRSDGRRAYCKICNKQKEIEKKKKNEDELIKESISNIIAPQKKEITQPEEKQKALKTYDVSVENLAKLIMKQYGDDLNKADEVFDLFINAIASGEDKTEASKIALTKSLELRIGAGENITKLIQIAAKMKESVEKSKNKFGLDLDNMRKNFGLDKDQDE